MYLVNRNYDVFGVMDKLFLAIADKDGTIDENSIVYVTTEEAKIFFTIKCACFAEPNDILLRYTAARHDETFSYEELLSDIECFCRKLLAAGVLEVQEES